MPSSPTRNLCGISDATITVRISDEEHSSSPSADRPVFHERNQIDAGFRILVNPDLHCYTV
jgi:hypothetical protein